MSYPTTFAEKLAQLDSHELPGEPDGVRRDIRLFMRFPKIDLVLSIKPSMGRNLD